MDLFDIYLRKQMKILAGRQKLAKSGREKLLAAASEITAASSAQKARRKGSRFYYRPNFSLPVLYLKSILAMLHLIWTPVNTMTFIENPSNPVERALYIKRGVGEWSNGLLNMGLLCSMNSNSVGFHLRL
jgi:hypothetical protein